MQNKDLNTKGNNKINRYNQIDLIGSYGIKDNYHIGVGSEVKNQVISVLKWLGVFMLLAIPIINGIALVVMACADINLNVKNFARATLIFMFIAIIAFLLYL